MQPIDSYTRFFLRIPLPCSTFRILQTKLKFELRNFDVKLFECRTLKKARTKYLRPAVHDRLGVAVSNSIRVFGSKRTQYDI